MTIKEPKYKEGDKVYHITKGSPEGIVMEVRYYISDSSFDYLVAWGYADKSWNVESELSDKRQ